MTDTISLRRWSPSRISDALSCGRRLQATIERWEKGPEQIGGVRGGVAHEALAGWETGHRIEDPVLLTTNAWLRRTTSLPGASALVAGAANTLELETSITEAEDVEFRKLEATGQWKNIRATKAFKEATAHLEPDRGYLAKMRADLAESERQLAAAGEIPWQVRRSFLDEGYFHSLETVRRGVRLVASLYPSPDIMGLEWELSAPLGPFEIHGFIDRVELCADGAVEVVDYKSSEYIETDLDHFVQAASYVVLVQHRTKLTVDRVRFVYLRDGNSAVFPVHISWPEKLEQLVVGADARIAAKAFAPSFRGCGICPYVAHCNTDFRMVRLTEQENAA